MNALFIGQYLLICIYNCWFKSVINSNVNNIFVILDVPVNAMFLSLIKKKKARYALVVSRVSHLVALLLIVEIVHKLGEQFEVKI